MSEPLQAAREAVQRSDELQHPSRNYLPTATLAETRAIRDALRALIQWAEEVEAHSPSPDTTSEEKE